MARLGKQLVGLHLLKSTELTTPISKFHGDGDDEVKYSVYDDKESRILVNESQYFSEVPEDVWGYYIGGYQVLYEWLKHRGNTKLSLEDIKQFCKIIGVIKKTIEVQNQIDMIYPNIEKETIDYVENSQNTSLDKFKE